RKKRQAWSAPDKARGGWPPTSLFLRLVPNFLSVSQLGFNHRSMSILLGRRCGIRDHTFSPEYPVADQGGHKGHGEHQGARNGMHDRQGYHYPYRLREECAV